MTMRLVWRESCNWRGNKALENHVQPINHSSFPRASPSAIRHSLVLRHSSFVISSYAGHASVVGRQGWERESHLLVGHVDHVELDPIRVAAQQQIDRTGGRPEVRVAEG